MSPVQVIDEEGNNLGVIETEKALQMARERELDLVEVAAKARPPVCKIMSWSKFKYELSKKSKGSSKGKAKERKEMRFSPYIGESDIEHKLKKVREFLAKKHPVKLTIRVRGRVTKEVVDEQMQDVLKRLEGEFETEEKPRREGRNLAINIFPAKKSTKKTEDSEKTDSSKSNDKKK